jgi:uncharacterized membrane protein YccC
MQGTLGATLGAGGSRVLGTLIGAAAGLAGALLRGIAPIPSETILALVVAPTAFVAGMRPALRIAPITAAIVVLAGSAGQVSLQTAVTRTFEILLGTVVGIATAYFVFPIRASTLVRKRASELLAALADLVRARFSSAGESECDALTARTRSLLAQLEAAAAESVYERRVHVAASLPAELVVSLRRLRVDVALLGRPAVRSEIDANLAPLGAAFAEQFAAAARRMRGETAPRSAVSVSALAHQLRAGSALAVALAVLAQDLEALQSVSEATHV